MSGTSDPAGPDRDRSNGAPRSGKSSIATAIQETFDGAWLNLGVDVARAMTPARLPARYRASAGRGDAPGGTVRPGALRRAVRVDRGHSRVGLNVVVDVGHHRRRRSSPTVQGACRGLPVLLVGVRCPIDVIMERRDASPAGRYATSSADVPVPEPVARWQQAVHVPGRLRHRGRHLPVEPRTVRGRDSTVLRRRPPAPRRREARDSRPATSASTPRRRRRPRGRGPADALAVEPRRDAPDARPGARSPSS